MTRVENKTFLKVTWAFVLLVGGWPVLGQESSTESPSYTPSTHGTRWLHGAGGLSIKVLVEKTNLGGTEVDIGEITFPAGSASGAHSHGAVEIFYVLSGELEHIVNGESHLLQPGMVGIVRVGDRVIHKVNSPDTPARALVIWAPGGEADRLARFFQQSPIQPK